MRDISKTLNATVKYFAQYQSKNADTLDFCGKYLSMIEASSTHLMQNIFEDIESIRLLLSRGGRPLPALPASFFLTELTESLDAHNTALIALHTVLEVMDDDANAQKLLRDLWNHLAKTAKRDVQIIG